MLEKTKTIIFSLLEQLHVLAKAKAEKIKRRKQKSANNQ